MKRGFEGGTRTGTVSAVDTVVAKWGNGEPAAVPEWVLVFAEACDAHSRSKVAERLAYSAATISQVLNANYNGDLGRVESVVRGALMSAVVACPVNGETPLNVCLADQKRTPPFASSWRMQVYRACRAGCPNYRGSK